MATSPTGTEIDQLLSFVAEQRYALRVTAHGLTDEQAGQAPTVSTLSVGALLKHTIVVEESWTAIAKGSPWSFADSLQRNEAGWAFGAQDTLEAVFAEQDRVAAETERVFREIGDLGHEVPVPQDVPWFPKDVPAWNLRWILAHLIEEIGRHAGHADLVRETVDGATMFPLRAAAEGWPESEWVTPWKPAQPAN